MAKSKKERREIFIVYKGLEKEIKELKSKVVENFKTEMRSYGCRFVAEWVDWSYAILYRDIYLFEYKNTLFQIRFSQGTKMIHIGNFTYHRFDTINFDELEKITCKSLLGYKINSENVIYKLEGTERHPKDKALTYKNLLRLDKISKLLNEN